MSSKQEARMVAATMPKSGYRSPDGKYEWTGAEWVNTEKKLPQEAEPLRTMRALLNQYGGEAMSAALEVLAGVERENAVAGGRRKITIRSRGAA